MDSPWMSRRISRIVLQSSSIFDYGRFTLSNLMEYLKESDIPGPFQLRDLPNGSKWLGEGAQFQVYGRRILVEYDFGVFDKPYLEPSSQQSRPERSLAVTLECVAIKRAKILAPQSPLGSKPLSDLTHHGVGVNQLRDTIQEVLCLTMPPLRQHPNIVKLLAWGYEEHEEGEQLFSPLLFMEQATMSLGMLCYITDIPLGARQHLCRGAAAGIKALHEYYIVHGDVKPDNILVFANRRDGFLCTAKIADFGHSVRDYNQDNLTPDIAPQGTEGWSAPELRNYLGLRVDLLYKCDIWSLALTVWSVMVLRGEKPKLENRDRASGLPVDWDCAEVPLDVLKSVHKSLTDMLLFDPLERIGHVENILRSLELRPYTLTTEEACRFMPNFQDTTDWDILETKALTDDLERFLLKGEVNLPSHTDERIRSARRSWAHSSKGSLDLAARDGRLRTHLIAERASMSDLFNVAIASALEGNYQEEISSLQQCAISGYLPAKAICRQVTAARKEITEVEIENISQNWVTEAAESGYLYWMWSTGDPPWDIRNALQRFRDAGGYNTHYCGTVSNTSEEIKRRGILGDLGKDLYNYPLHLAAAFNELRTPTGQSSLIKGANLDEKDKWGDTALMKCCMAGHLDALSVLVENGAGKHVNEMDGLTPLHWLFVFSDDDVDEAARLLSLARVDFKGLYYARALEAFHFPFAWPSGGPLHWATFANNSTAVRILVSYSVPIDQKDAAH